MIIIYKIIGVCILKAEVCADSNVVVLGSGNCGCFLGSSLAGTPKLEFLSLIQHYVNMSSTTDQNEFRGVLYSFPFSHVNYRI